MSRLLFGLLVGLLLNLLGVLSDLGERWEEIRGDSGTLKISLLSAAPDFGGEGDHVTLFLGVLFPSAEALTGVLRMPFSGLCIGLCLVGVCSAFGVLLAGDLKGLLLRAAPEPSELPATGLSLTTCFDTDGPLGVLGVRGVLGVLGDLFP